MSIKARIIALSLIGNLCIAGIFFALSDYQNRQQEQSSVESSAILYGQAWRTVLNDTFASSLGLFHPQTGSPENTVLWSDPASSEQPEEALAHWLYGDDIEKNLESYVTEKFDDAFAWGEISFVTIFDAEGRKIYCGTAEEGYGIDPCDESAIPDFISEKTSRLKLAKADEFSLGAVRGLSTVVDRSAEMTPAFFQTLIVELKRDQKKVGAVVLGKNIAEALEIFEYDFL